MKSTLFGEGMTWMEGNKLVQITWKSQQGFIYDANTLDQIDEFTFDTTKKQGWGITWDACKGELIVTDGSEFLHFWDPETMAERRKVPVTRIDGKQARELNEIELCRGRFLANVWYADVLLVIHPATGKVEK
jgi:glutamine cyclotransferase